MAEVPTKGYITEVGFYFDLKSTGKADSLPFLKKKKK
jgi:hypothetical protein